MSRKKLFNESLIDNMQTYESYVNRLTELALSRFKWKNLPNTCDERFLELTLFKNGSALLFNDDVMGIVHTPFSANGSLDIYNNPVKRVSIAPNGYYNTFDNNNSVIIYNNYLRNNNYDIVLSYAKRLYNLDRIIDVNSNAQKTPILIQTTEQQRLTMQNLYKDFQGNMPIIFANKDLDMNALKVLKTDAPFICDKIYELKVNLWNEVLTYLGIANVSINKKERLVSDEVNRSMGGVIANRKSHLKTRELACQQINKMFNLDIKVYYDYDENDEVVRVE